MLNDPKEATASKRKAPVLLQYYHVNIISPMYDEILFCCLSHKEAQDTLMEDHDGTCGTHQLGPKLGDRLQRLGYY